MSSLRKTYALFVFSEAWKARLPPLRLKATLAEVTLRGADFVLLTSEACDPDTGAMTAERWTAGGWESAPCPPPDVVAIWGGGPVLKRQQAVYDWLRSRFRVIRAAGPNKATLSDFLDGGPVERYLIPQMPLPTSNAEQAVSALIAGWGAIVVKPGGGSSGKGVQFVLPDGDGWVLRSGSDSFRGSAGDVAAALVRSIGGRLGYRPFLAQKYVRSLAPDGRALQFRIDLHKDGKGQWRLIQRCAHLGGVGLLVSNIARGGCLGSFVKTIELRTARPAEELIEEAMALALGVARALDAHPGASVFEVGVDIAIDEQDRLWLFEVNLFPETTVHELERAALAVDYGLAIANGALVPDDDRLYA